MGNTRSTAGRDCEWKGPFSDEEYACLENKFKEAIVEAPSEAAAAANLQTWLELPLPAASEGLSAPCRQLGAAFYRLCVETNEDRETGKSGKLQMVNFAQG
ncbi:hypothetical protein PHPALM_10583, partial [Phytophthora palmivora]